MSADPDYGECYSCGCEGMIMTLRQLAERSDVETETVIGVVVLPFGKVQCDECYYKCRTQLLEATAAMLEWEVNEMKKEPKTKTQEYFQ